MTPSMKVAGLSGWRRFGTWLLASLALAGLVQAAEARARPSKRAEASTPPPSPAYEAPPRLPSPRGGLYLHHEAPPLDPLVAQVLAGRPWDEVLSGAAAGAAIEALAGVPVDATLARWRAVVAGYPYPIVGVASERVPQGTLPTRIAAALPSVEGDLGLVRMRGLGGDIWVLIVGRRRAELPTLPREVAVGATVDLGDLEWVAGDPDGGVRRVQGALTLDRAGEWLLQASRDGVIVASIPLYAGMSTPEEPPIASYEADPRAALLAVRAWYGQPDTGEEPLLDAIARSRLRAWTAGEALPELRDQLRAAGFVGLGAAATCQAPSVSACLADIWWDPEARGALVGASEAAGLAWSAEAGKVRMVVVSAG